MLVGGMVEQNIWFKPWDAKSKALFVQAFLQENGEIVAVKYLPGEEDEAADLLREHSIAAEGKPVLLEPKPGRFVKHSLLHASWLVGNPEVDTRHEIMSLSRCAGDAVSDIVYKTVRAFKDLARKIAAFRYRRLLSVDFRPVPPEDHLRGLWVSECPRCCRQMVLEESDSDPDPDDPYDSNLTVWLEGQYMNTHTHPIDTEQTDRDAREILLSHLRSGCKDGRINMEEGYMREIEASAEWGLDVWRTGEGELDVRCTLCHAGTYFDCDATIYKAEQWALEHDCGDREEANLMRDLLL